ncbi:MAG: T9SS type A sorting domain-containing protein, partial [Bacteroidia bacterium]
SGIQIKWSTASELNNSYFKIESSTDGATFSSIATIDGSGTTSEIINYTFEDENPSMKTYYRIKQVDYDGAYTYSRVISHSPLRGLNEEIDIKHNRNHISLSHSKRNSIRVQIFSVLGNLVLETTGDSEVVLDRNSLPKGILIARIEVDGQMQQKALLNN